jgi:acyl carrier protein
MNEDQRLVECFKRVFPELPDHVIRDADMKRLGAWDSARLLALIVVVEKEFTRRFDVETINRFTSFAAILSAVRSSSSGMPAPAST